MRDLSKQRSRQWSTAILPLLVVLFCASNSLAQVSIDRIFPPVISVGQETEITVEGKFPQWPVEIDCDRSDIVIVAGKESGKLTVQPAKGTASAKDTAPGKNTAPGVAWIRIHDDQSASALIPLLISATSVTVEKEPNDKRSEANKLSLPTTVAGRLTKSGDSDAYRVSVKAGQQLVASVTANEVLKSPMDTVMQLTDTDGNVLVQSDDVCGLDPQITYTSSSGQDLLIRLFAFPETPNSTVGFGGSAAYRYTMDVTTGAFVDHVADADEGVVPFGYNLGQSNVIVESEATEISPVTATVQSGLGWAWRAAVDPKLKRVLYTGPTSYELPVVVSGHISKPQEIHSFSFSATKGTKYRAEVRSKIDGFLLDSKLTIVHKKTDKTLASNDDVASGRYDAGVDFTANEDGEIEVRLSELLEGFGPRHFYQLSVREIEPSFRLSVSADHFLASSDQPLEIAVSVSRDSGFKGKIRITAEALPQGVTADPVISEIKGDTSKSVKLKLIAGKDSAGHGTFQILGTVLDSDDKPTEQTVAATYALRPAIALSRFWLTVPPSKKDKTSSDKKSADKAKP